MIPLQIFISSVQGEFAREREALRNYVRGDPLMRRFCETFLFEDVPATDRRPKSGAALTSNPPMGRTTAKNPPYSVRKWELRPGITIN